MGAGIAEVFARHGYDVVGVEVDDEGVGARPPAPRALDGAGRLPRQADRGGAAGAARPGHLRHLAGGAQGRRPGRRGRRGVGRRSRRQIFQQLDGIVSEDAILATNTSSLSVTEISAANAHPGRVIGVHFFNPAPVQGFVEIVQTVVTEPERARGRLHAGAGARQEPRRVRRQGRLHRQHAALRLPQPRGLDVRGPLRLARGHRRRDALRLRLPDGPAGPARPDRPRHGVRDPRHDVPPGPRPAARALADPQADGHRRACSAARPAAASTATRAPTAPSSSPTTRRRRPTTSRSCGTTSSRSAWSAPARWRPASSRSSPRAGTTSSTSAAPRTRSTGSPATIERSLDKAIQRGKLEESAKADVLGRLTGTTSLDDLAHGRHRRRGDRRGPEDQDHAVREPRRDLQAGRDPGHHDLVAADHRVRPGDQAGPQDVVGMHFFNPAPIMKLVEVVSTVSTSEEVTETTRALCAKVGKVAGLLRRPGRASSSTRCCSPTSTTRSRCSRRTTRPPTTSTPR